jgi:hypothetical protein
LTERISPSPLLAPFSLSFRLYNPIRTQALAHLRSANERTQFEEWEEESKKERRDLIDYCAAAADDDDDAPLPCRLLCLLSGPFANGVESMQTTGYSSFTIF